MGEKEQTNNMDLGQLQAQDREFCVTILCSFLCICRLPLACIFRETSTKATRNANSSSTVFPHCLLLLTVLPLDCHLTLPGLFCSPLSTALSGFLCQQPLSLLSDLPLLVHFRSRGRSWAQALCLGFAPKQTKRSSAQRTHPHSVTLCGCVRPKVNLGVMAVNYVSLILCLCVNITAVGFQS